MLLQILLYTSFFFACGGSFYLMIVMRNTEISIDVDFWDLPLKIKLGFFAILIGGLGLFLWLIAKICI